MGVAVLQSLQIQPPGKFYRWGRPRWSLALSRPDHTPVDADRFNRRARRAVLAVFDGAAANPGGPRVPRTTLSTVAGGQSKGQCPNPLAAQARVTRAGVASPCLRTKKKM